MMKSRNKVVVEVKNRREALWSTWDALQQRVSPPQLAEDALNLIDRDLAILGRMKSRIERNKVLSLAVLAGVGWLMGAPRNSSNHPRRTRTSGIAQTPTKAKENQDDSGKDPGHDWAGPDHVGTSPIVDENGRPAD